MYREKRKLNNRFNQNIQAINFEDYLQGKGIIEKTIKRHEAEVSKFESWLLESGKTLDTANKKDIINYLESLEVTRGLKNSTKNQVLGMLKNYYDFICRNGLYLGRINPTHFIKIRGVKRQHLRPLFTKTELEELCDAFYYFTKDQTSNRNQNLEIENKQQYLVLTLMAFQGLNVNEIFKLSKENIDLRKGIIHVPKGRRSAGRILKLEASQMGAFYEYYKEKPQLQLIPNLNHVFRLSKKLKTINHKFLDFRQIRASRISLWIKEDKLRKAQISAGHKNINSTEKYVANDIESMHKELELFHPLIEN